MKQLKNMQIIGIDNGYGNLKTASGIFPASVLTFDHERVHTQDLLVYNGKYHVIGSGHREFTPDKVSNPDHYFLTLAGIGQELWKNRMTEARVYIAAGLPLTWVESQRESFRAYLLQNDHVDFIWRGIEYHVDIVSADVYAQGFSAIVPMLKQFKGVNMLCDIGNGTMNIMTMIGCLYDADSVIRKDTADSLLGGGTIRSIERWNAAHKEEVDAHDKAFAA